MTSNTGTEDSSRQVGSFSDLLILREAMRLLLSEIHTSEGFSLVSNSGERSQTRAIAFQILRENYEAFTKRLDTDGMMIRFVPAFARSVCDPKPRADVESFFNTQMGHLEITAQKRRETLEVISVLRCGRLSRASSPPH